MKIRNIPCRHNRRCSLNRSPAIDSVNSCNIPGLFSNKRRNAVLGIHPTHLYSRLYCTTIYRMRKIQHMAMLNLQHSTAHISAAGWNVIRAALADCEDEVANDDQHRVCPGTPTNRHNSPCTCQTPCRANIISAYCTGGYQRDLAAHPGGRYSMLANKPYNYHRR